MGFEIILRANVWNHCSKIFCCIRRKSRNYEEEDIWSKFNVWYVSEYLKIWIDKYVIRFVLVSEYS